MASVVNNKDNIIKFRYKQKDNKRRKNTQETVDGNQLKKNLQHLRS